MNRLIKCLFCSLLLPFTVSAQKGDFFVSQFSPSFNQEDQIYFDLQFTDNDELIAANRSGIVRYDGTEWNLIPTPSAPLSVALDERMNIYVACANDFGRIVINQGTFSFQSLAPLSTDRLLTKQVLFFDEKVYFLQDNRLFEYDPISSDVQYYDSDSVSGSFIYMFPFDGMLLTESISSSYYLKDSLSMGVRILPDSGIVISAAMQTSTQQMILSSYDGNVYRYDKEVQKIDSFEGKIINDLAWVSKDIFAASTLSEGVFFYDLSKREMIEQTDSRNGLPDNEIFAIATDHSSGVWVANSFGFSRIAPLLPIRSFNHYPGLAGNLTTAVYNNDTWHLATSDGVYFFDQIDNYKNKVYYVPKKVATSKNSAAPKAIQSAPMTSNKGQGIKAGGFRSRVTGLLNKNNEEEAQLKSSAQQKPRLQQLKTNVTKVFQTSTSKASDLLSRIKLPIGDKNKLQYERRVKKELISTQYLYNKIPDITEKIKQLIAFEDAIIAVTPTGIIEIRDQVAEEIFSEPVRYVYRSPKSKSLWVSTQSGVIYQLEEVDDVWIEKQSIESLGDVILSIYSDTLGHVWMAGANQLFELSVADTAINVLESYMINNQFFDHIKLTRINGQLALINSQGVFKLDTVQSEIRRDEALMKELGSVKRHLQQSDGRVWVYDGSNWNRIEFDGKISTYTYLKLFPAMSFIDQIDDEIWLINSFSSLFKFTQHADDSIPDSRMFIREIQDASGLLSTGQERLKISYEKNSVFIDLARPDYMGLSNVQFSYRMSGLSEDWSDWSSNHQLAFNYLPAGDYTLQVKSVDVFGREQALEPLEIKITPPYWQTTWFSALQVLFFTALVLIASRMNRSNKESKKLVILANLLTIVTIVMVIELLQNIAESYFGDLGSPVMAFGLDVLVALFIFPVEMLLRKIVTGASSPTITPAQGPA